MDEQPFPRPLKFLEKENGPLIKHFYALVGRTGPLSSAWLLAVNQVAAAYPGLAPRLPIGSPDPATQRGMQFLGSSLNVLRVTPIDYLIERLQEHAPDLVRVCGRFLYYNLESCMLRDVRQNLGFPPEPPFRWRGESLTATNPVRIVEDNNKIIFTLPSDVNPRDTHKYLVQANAYRNAFRPAKPRGCRPKPPGAPPTTSRTASDAEARRAWELFQHDPNRTTIAQALFPDSPMGTERERRRVLAKVDRRIARGRRLASPPPQR